ncbi:MAG TPA: metallophosphoesterase [Candidatus Limnocylindrales bacterium]|nr:metallophosphoesterase [Candidatus Limnocylindrales bacterium]
MLRLLHTADVHLGARHADLGDAAATQRERQFAAFAASVDLALSERVDLFLVAGDLFDSNVQPRRSVERVAAELARLVQSRVRTVLVPGTHDVYDRSSVYRAYDLAAMAGASEGGDLLTVLTPERPWLHIGACDVVVHGPVFATKRAPHSPLRDLASVRTPDATWRLGILHAAIAIPGRTDHDEVVITTDEIAASGLDYLALGHWHGAQVAKARGVTYAYAGAPEPIALDQDKAGKVLLVTLEQRDGVKAVKVEERVVGRTTFERVDVDAATVGSQPALVARLRAAADKDRVLAVRLIGVRPDELDLDVSEVEEALKGDYLRVRVRDGSQAPLTDGTLPPPETIAGAFIRTVEGRITVLEGSADTAAAREAEELRDALRLGRLLLAGKEVTL